MRPVKEKGKQNLKGLKSALLRVLTNYRLILLFFVSIANISTIVRNSSAIRTFHVFQSTVFIIINYSDHIPASIPHEYFLSNRQRIDSESQCLNVTISFLLGF